MHCLSGGADGADKLFGELAAREGHEVTHFSFERHKSFVPQNTIAKLSQEELEMADPVLKTVSKTIKRYFPAKSLYVNNLLRRNYYQVFRADRVYAVSHFEDGIVAGGTAWAVMMAIHLHDLPEIYFFDQKTEQWWGWNDGWFERSSVHVPHGIYAGIGSRDLNPAGEQAIRNLYDVPF